MADADTALLKARLHVAFLQHALANPKARINWKATGDFASRAADSGEFELKNGDASSITGERLGDYIDRAGPEWVFERAPAEGDKPTGPTLDELRKMTSNQKLDAANRAAEAKRKGRSQ